MELCVFKIGCIENCEGKVWVEYSVSLTIDFGESISSRKVC